jgi:hypothetical protein
MFPPPLHSRPAQAFEAAAGSPAPIRDWTAIVAGLRLAGSMLVLASASGQRVSAQSIGTMQVTARVIPATASWAALDEARVAIRWLTRQEPEGPTVSSTGVLRTRAEVQATGSRRRLIVTVDHPRN